MKSMLLMIFSNSLKYCYLFSRLFHELDIIPTLSKKININSIHRQLMPCEVFLIIEKETCGKHLAPNMPTISSKYKGALTTFRIETKTYAILDLRLHLPWTAL